MPLDLIRSISTASSPTISIKVQQSQWAMYTGEDLAPHKIPLIGRFYGNSENRSSQGNAFYSNLKRSNEVEAGFNQRVTDLKQEARQ